MRRLLNFGLVVLTALLIAAAPAKTQQPSPQPAVTKICFIGNSHVTALRQALRRGYFADPKLDLVFWSFPGRSYRGVKFENGSFTHPDKQRALKETNGRYETIDPKAFDDLVFVGPGFLPGAILPRLERQGRRDPAAVESKLRQVISDAPELQLMISAVRGYAGKVYFVPAPLKSEQSRQQNDVAIEREQFDQFNQIATKIFAESGIIYIPQPPETIVDNRWTKTEYVRGNNVVHMNAQYGKLILDAIRARLQASP